MANRKGTRHASCGLWALVAGLVLWPLCALLWTTGSEIAGAGATGSGGLLGGNALPSLWNSLWSAAVGTALAVVIGYGMAYACVHLDARRATWAHLAAMLPLLVPPFVGAFSWVQAYAKSGTVDWLFGCLAGSGPEFTGLGASSSYSQYIRRPSPT
ncbi:hypothetical protein [Alicyclobacillus acidoterrestris]|uniref:Uncharacterized protein n=1 Tax=Alicyclobacillus acidoterrestris (strain ATCC 49025 / DSM 3922 / CIP 106132 / NCIMB 13137 / GD3B) TaxID=1356854 RepID=T0BPE0_ALIAG|nr:hypothetical protein [Alicyclobacillus acidoterrestris]EPZ42425.1 hypothetical protein N007_14975 [Alicyclobacillus acidoterrestris ATCC 49025]UNO47246.1 hypothetical protein K1I37_10885 [Alicyclobacillus acidoterrestris]